MNKLFGVSDNFIDKSVSLIHGCTIDAFLHHTTSVLVSRYFFTFVNHGVEDELIQWTLECEESFLNHMEEEFNSFGKWLDRYEPRLQVMELNLRREKQGERKK